MSDGINKQMIHSDLEFRDFVVESLTQLKTNMTALVGQDGSGGKIQDQEKRIASLEESRTVGRTIMAALGVLWTVGMSIGGYLFSKGK